jgi:hypothetical protein
VKRLEKVALAALRTWRKDQADRRLYMGAAWNDSDDIIDGAAGGPCAPRSEPLSCTRR